MAAPWAPPTPFGRGVIAAGFLLIGAASQASAADEPIVQPMWRPGRDISHFVPERAMRMQVNGWARLRCRVGDDYRAKECIVVGEDPADYGFGLAALKIIGVGQFAPLAHGQPTAGRMAIEKINFPLGRNASEDWSARPSSRDIAKARPSGAEAFGMADVTCGKVAPDGSLQNCSVRGESPAGEGFGAAALSLAGHFRQRSLPVPALKVSFWVNWTDPASKVVPPGMQIDLIGPPKITPIVTVSDSSRIAGSTMLASKVFVSSASSADIAKVRPTGVVENASVNVTCDVTAEGTMSDCKGAPYEATAPAYVPAALSLSHLYRYSPVEIAKFRSRPAAWYRVNWEPR